MKRHCRLLAALIAAILAMGCALPALAHEDEAAAPQQAVTIIPAAEVPMSEKAAGHAKEESTAPRAEVSEAGEAAEKPEGEAAKGSKEEAGTGGEAAGANTARVPEKCGHPDFAVEKDKITRKIVDIKSVGAAGHAYIYEVYAGDYCDRCGRMLTESVYVGTEEGEVIPHTFYGGDEGIYTCTCGERSDVLRCAHDHLRFAQYLYGNVIDVPTYVDADCHTVTATVSGEIYACDDCGGAVTKAYDEPRVETIKVPHDFYGPKCECGAVSNRTAEYAEDILQFGGYKDSEE